MTKVYLVPWLVVIAITTWLADWISTVRSDHAQFLLSLAGGFAIYDGAKWLARKRPQSQAKNTEG